MKDKSVGIIPISKKDNNYVYLTIHQTEGHWGFPKGHPNINEEEINTAVRELFEETSITRCSIVDNFKYTQEYIFEKNGESVQKEVIFFIGLIESQEVKIDNNEIQDFKWLPLEDALNQLTHTQNQQMLANAADFIKKQEPLIAKQYLFNPPM